MSTNTEVKQFTDDEKRKIALKILNSKLKDMGVMLAKNQDVGLYFIKKELGLSDEDTKAFAEGLLSGNFFNSLFK